MLRTRAILENATDAPLTAAIQSQWEVAPGDLASTVLRYRKQAGGAMEKAFIEPAKMPSGSEAYNGGDLPDGEWRVVNRQGGTWVSRFPKDQVGRCDLSWTAKSEKPGSHGNFVCQPLPQAWGATYAGTWTTEPNRRTAHPMASVMLAAQTADEGEPDEQ